MNRERGIGRIQEAEAKEYLDALEKAGIEESDLKDSPLEQWFAMGKALSKNQKEKLKEPFTYKKLIDVIRAELGDTAKKSFLLTIIPNYSELSGFVHGGPTTAVMVELREANLGGSRRHEGQKARHSEVHVNACQRTRSPVETVGKQSVSPKPNCQLFIIATKNYELY